jgi:hypothetical protein
MAACFYAECHLCCVKNKQFMLSVIMLNVITLNIVMLGVVVAIQFTLILAANNLTLSNQRNDPRHNNTEM